jgi:hypothetical protein
MLGIILSPRSFAFNPHHSTRLLKEPPKPPQNHQSCAKLAAIQPVSGYPVSGQWPFRHPPS